MKTAALPDDVSLSSHHAETRSGLASIHASCILLDDTGVLILGESGSGKTTLALGLLDRWRRSGRFARLVSDDRTLLWISGGRTLACAHPLIAGKYELFGAGIKEAPHEKAAVLRAAVRCEKVDGPRFPEHSPLNWNHGGMSLPMTALGLNCQRELVILSFLARIRPCGHEWP